MVGHNGFRSAAHALYWEVLLYALVRREVSPVCTHRCESHSRPFVSRFKVQQDNLNKEGPQEGSHR